MPASSPAVNASYLSMAYAARMAGQSWDSIRRTYGNGGATNQQVRRAVVRWAADNNRPDPCARRTATASARFARMGGQVAAAATGLTFGVEIEFQRPVDGGAPMDPQTIADALNDAGVPTQVEDYNHRTRDHWKLIYDASSDRELVSPILSGDDGIRQVTAALRVLRQLGCRVTASEGLHVHVGVGHLQPRQVVAIAETYTANSDQFDSLVAASRRPGRDGSRRWCRHLSASELRRSAQAADAGSSSWYAVERYRSVNMLAFGTHGTVEFRQHQGTLNGRKVAAWVRLLLGLVDHSAANGVSRRFGSVREMASTFGLPDNAAAYLAQRATSLGGTR